MNKKELHNLLNKELENGDTVFLQAANEKTNIAFFKATEDEYSLLSTTHPKLYAFLLLQQYKIEQHKIPLFIPILLIELIFIVNFDYSNITGIAISPYLKAGLSISLFFIVLYRLQKRENQKLDNCARVVLPAIEEEIERNSLNKKLVLKTLSNNKSMETIRKVLSDDFTKQNSV
ncbi:hypothetical protein [Candidatus Uabimicrobium sp. HlEnr_7]|uniref:hypothetical protein n=1 Tax=Candidatus Uabimicrobium helgolandensis TaxID=3095367 RepID=UPI003557351A